MGRFTVRVELHNANAKDYENLHAQMGANGFSRTIASDGGNSYHLPWTGYNYEGNLSGNQVLEAAKSAASRAHNDFAVLVTESAKCWHNLYPT